MGAMIMNMMSSMIATSTSEVTLISAMRSCSRRSGLGIDYPRLSRRIRLMSSLEKWESSSSTSLIWLTK